MKKKKTYWKNVEQIDNKSTLIKDIENKEFANQLPVDKILLNQEMKVLKGKQLKPAFHS